MKICYICLIPKRFKEFFKNKCPDACKDCITAYEEFLINRRKEKDKLDYKPSSFIIDFN